jgi:hypothetical protein
MIFAGPLRDRCPAFLPHYRAGDVREGEGLRGAERGGLMLVGSTF